MTTRVFFLEFDLKISSEMKCTNAYSEMNFFFFITFHPACSCKCRREEEAFKRKIWLYTHVHSSNVCLLKSTQVNIDKEMNARQMMRDKHCLIRFLRFFFSRLLLLCIVDRSEMMISCLDQVEEECLVELIDEIN